MLCRNVQQRLGEYRNGRLDPETHNLIDQHLANCPDCRKVLEEEESVSKFLETMDSPDMKSSLASDLMKRVTQEEESKRKRPLPLSLSRMTPLAKWSLIASMLILFFVIGIFVYSFKPVEYPYYTTYGEAGYTWMGPQDESMKELFESTTRDILSGAEGGGSWAAITEPEHSKEEDDKVVHTFDFSGEEEDRVISEFNIEEQADE
jgi:Putative zinc-finger